MLAPFQNVESLLVRLVADGLRIRPGGRDEEIQRLHTSVPGAFGHDIEEFSVGLGMEFIEHHPVYVEAVLGIVSRISVLPIILIQNNDAPPILY